MLTKLFSKAVRDFAEVSLGIGIIVTVLVGSISLADLSASFVFELFDFPEANKGYLTFALWMFIFVFLGALVDAYKMERKTRKETKPINRVLDYLLLEKSAMPLDLPQFDFATPELGGINEGDVSERGQRELPRKPRQEETGQRVDLGLGNNAIIELEILKERLWWMEKNMVSKYDVVKVVALFLAVLGAIAKLFGVV